MHYVNVGASLSCVYLLGWEVGQQCLFDLIVRGATEPLGRQTARVLLRHRQLHTHTESMEGMRRASRQCSGGWMIVGWAGCVCTSMRRASLSSAVAPKCRLLSELYSCTMSAASSRSFSS